MREGQFIGMTADGEALVVELAGEHVRVPADHGLRKALAGDGQMSIPLEARVTPREVQHRIRCGQTAAEIAAATGVAVELIAPKLQAAPGSCRRKYHGYGATLPTDSTTAMAASRRGCNNSARSMKLARCDQMVFSTSRLTSLCPDENAALSFSADAVKSARSKAKKPRIMSAKSGFGGIWVWSLPDEDVAVA